MMLCLRFRMDSSSFGLDVGRLEELVPWVELWPLKTAPGFIRGCFNYRGLMTPVVDMSMLFSGKLTKRTFSSRIAVMPYHGHFLGALLEGAVETVQIGEAEFQDACVRSEASPYLGRMALKDGELLQIVDCDLLLSDKARDVLFPGTEAKP